MEYKKLQPFWSFLYEHGNSQQEIAEIYGCSDTTVSKHIREYGVETGYEWRETTPVEERFWDKVDVKGEDECWEWQASTQSDGYGQIRSQNTVKRAHRVALETLKGPIDDGKIVCHHCDNPICCNPNHLYEGTHKSNAEDKVERGRQKSTLDKEDVLEIRMLYAYTDLSGYDLTEMYDVQRSTISSIYRGHTWRHVGGPIKGIDY